jgi:hypothetical protein
VRFLRSGLFAFDPDRSSIRRDDPLAPVIGGGVLLLEESDDEATLNETTDG